MSQVGISTSYNKWFHCFI